MPLRILISTTVLFLLLVSSTFAQQGIQDFTVEKAISYALDNSPLVSNAQLDISIAKKKVYETTAMGLPQVNGAVSFQNFLDIPTQVIPANAFNPNAPADELVPVKFGTDYNTSASVSANQLIFDGAYIVGLQAARTYKELSLENLSRTEASVREQVSQSFYTAVIMQENLEILNSSLNNVTRLREEMEQIFQAGMAEEQDVEQLLLTEKDIQNMVSRTKRQADLALNLLKLNMGMPLETSIILVYELEAISGLLPPTVDTTFNPESHYDLRTALTNQQLMRLNMKKEKFAYLPSISAFIQHQQNALRNEFDIFDGDQPWYPSTVWGLNINIPLFDSGIKGARIGQARMEYEKSINMAEFTRDQLKLQAEAKRADLLSAAERYTNEEENVALAQRIFDKTLIKYKEGLASSLELNQAQTQLLNTQSRYINSVLELLTAKTAFDKALGK